MSGNALVDVREVVRCARGLVRTAHPEKIYDGIVREWWNALVAALDDLDAPVFVSQESKPE